jgi:hypothetical protein
MIASRVRTGTSMAGWLEGWRKLLEVERVALSSFPFFDREK